MDENPTKIGWNKKDVIAGLTIVILGATCLWLVVNIDAVHQWGQCQSVPSLLERIQNCSSNHGEVVVECHGGYKFINESVWQNKVG